MNKVKYFLQNKESDYKKGMGYNVAYINGKLQMQNGEQEAYFFSALFDSKEKETNWARLKLNKEATYNKMLTLYLFTSETPYLFWHEERYEIKQMIKDDTFSAMEKIKIFSNFLRMRVENPKDFILNGVTGRYLWMVICMQEEAGMIPQVESIQIYFPKCTWLDYLPEVYQKQEKPHNFLEGYLSIFQWIYYDITQKIYETPHMLYPKFADMEFLEWMGSWFAIENSMIWNREQLIYLIENAIRLYGMRGTKEYTEEMVTLYTGCKPYIIEFYATKDYKTDMKKTWILEKLYGENAYVVTIVLPVGAVKNRQELVILRQVVESSLPAYMECRIIILEPYIFLSRYSYLGMNSRLEAFREMRVDDNGLIPYISMVGRGLA